MTGKDDELFMIQFTNPPFPASLLNSSFFQEEAP